MRALFLSSIWPEPMASAAGVRTAALLRAFQEWGYSTHFGCAAAPHDGMSSSVALLGKIYGAHALQVRPNHENELQAAIEAARPDVVVFDRYYTEESFSWAVKILAPKALRVLDMQDLHCLRKAREKFVKDESKNGNVDLPKVLRHHPNAQNEVLVRELAAVMRSDLNLVCSPIEMDLLENVYGVQRNKLALASFFASEATPRETHSRRAAAFFDDVEDEAMDEPYVTSTDANADAALANAAAASAQWKGFGFAKPFSARSHFVTVGTFRHSPNVDGLKYLKSDIWPKIRARLPSAQLDVYGSYSTSQLEAELEDEVGGFRMRGSCENLDVLADARVLLCCVRAGAGIKGKVVDAWRYGTPVVSTVIGAEGIGDTAHADWGGVVAGNTDDFAAAAVRLHENEAAWTAAQLRAREMLAEHFDASKNLAALRQAVEEAVDALEVRRGNDYVGSLLWHHTARSTEFFSRWVVQKEALKFAEQAEESKVWPTSRPFSKEPYKTFKKGAAKGKQREKLPKKQPREVDRPDYWRELKPALKPAPDDADDCPDHLRAL
ncbi:glycosyl transferases group 1-domain-containing protein [Pelagophyceae sp. CCMP2097]|nr:glycosyl transferases group 1-domain-containing protein [Pelagophyceae sp. CCMP2097]